MRISLNKTTELSAVFKELFGKGIDQKINGDINVTSPTGLKTLYDLSKKNLAKIFWKDLKA